MMSRWISSFWARLRQVFRDGSEESLDPEVRDVFLSELDEISAAMTALLPGWREQRRNTAVLQEIRRGFHTLKGSARVVGVNDLGAFCARIEKLALDLIERPGTATPAAVASIESAIGLLPACARAMRAGAPLPPALHAVARSVQGD